MEMKKGGGVFYILGQLECFLGTLLIALLVFAVVLRDREAERCPTPPSFTSHPISGELLGVNTLNGLGSSTPTPNLQPQGGHDPVLWPTSQFFASVLVVMIHNDSRCVHGRTVCISDKQIHS